MLPTATGDDVRASLRDSAIERTRKFLKVVPGPSIGHANFAQPVLIIASTHPVDLACGNCGTVLLHGTALVLHVHALLIQCGECGSYNATD